MVSHCAFHLYFSLFCASPAPLAPLMALITQYYGHILSHWMECPQCLSNQLKDPLSPVPSMSLFPHRWFFPIIGHMGICTSTGVIRDFAGPYFVSEDNMAFGKPAKYWKLDPAQVYASRPNAWDTAVHDASEEYKHRMHNLCCDNCHSHVALALNLMRYNNSTNWNMVTLCFFCLLYGKYVSVGAFVKTWLPFVLLLGIILTISLVFNLR
ncbi:transmembrane protein 222 isoform X1 [Rousettus aegyptiacus]|nr:transmembrane protein 222 isoform X1 [Rousettus aegyptiacus]